MKAVLLTKLFDPSRRLEGEGDVNKHIYEIEEIRKRLSRLGAEPDKEHVMGQIKRDLPRHYDPIIAAMQLQVDAINYEQPGSTFEH